MADREVQKGIWPQVVGAMAGLAALVAATIPALAFDKVTFGLNWLADPEAGGYYQAVVDGTYSNYGLEVTILPGRPQSNGGILLVAGKIDFFQGGDLLGNFLAEERNIPIVAVAADFQRDPQISCRIRAWASTNGPTCRTPRPPMSAPGACIPFTRGWRRRGDFPTPTSSPMTSTRRPSSSTATRSRKAT